jgi:Phage capsid family
MEEKDIQDLLNKAAEKNGEAIGKAVKDAVAAAAKGFITSEQMETSLEKMSVSKETIDALTKAVEKQGLELLKLTGSGTEKKEGIEEALVKNSDAIKALAEAKSGVVSFKVNKAIVNRATVSGNTMGYREPGIGQLAYKGLVMENLWPTLNLSPQDVAELNGTVYFMDQAAKTRNAAPVAESGTKPETAISWIQRSIPLQVIANHIPVTKQAYRHLSFVKGEIDLLLNENLSITRDTQLYRGDGVSPNLIGLITSAPALVNANLPNAGLLVDANLYDLIASLRVLITQNKQSKYMPNVVLMNPSDILRYKLAKATDGHYLLPPFVSADGMRIDTVTVVESSEVTANTMCIGDFSRGLIYRSEQVTITMGLIANQFIQNQWTILAEEEMALRIRNVDADGYLFVSNITTAIQELNV